MSDVRIRPASPADDVALQGLAQLDSTTPLLGEVLLAEVDGKVHAAWSVTERRFIADPFHPTEALRELLILRTAQLQSARWTHEPMRTFRRRLLAR